MDVVVGARERQVGRRRATRLPGGDLWRRLARAMQTSRERDALKAAAPSVEVGRATGARV